ncbi:MULTISPECIES: CDP-glycerol glycerophosphotransferase family protein [Enterobacterales]|uniref:CDP-glycerol glycerophosphotransferase family protein n=1 Tax=Enterobacterales TaxID=91347 RepID=UPI0029E0E2E1|nr:CDP-glycerol glycerophosphotransferase family protein [Proteus mirabilis]
MAQITLILKKILKKGFKFLFTIIIFYPLYVVSFLIPRNKKIMCIGSSHGFRDNAKYYYLYENSRDIKKYWISNSYSDNVLLQKKGIKSHYKWSLKGLYLSLVSKFHIYDYNIDDINFWTSGRAIKFNLWHGVGIKNIEFKIKIGSSKKHFNKLNLKNIIFSPYIYIKPDFFLSTSDMMDKHFCECFRIHSNAIIHNIYPRCQFFLKNKKKLLNHIKRYESSFLQNLILKKSKEFNKLHLYVPTWRDSGKDFISKINWYQLNDTLAEKNELFLIKPHPNTILKTHLELSNILYIPNKEDIYPLMPFTDTLITDYSSVYYDYLLLRDKKIILFLFDYIEYVKNERDLAFDFNEFTAGVKVYNYDDFFNSLFFNGKKSLSDYKKEEKIIHSFWEYTENKKSINDQLISKINHE